LVPGPGNPFSRDTVTCSCTSPGLVLLGGIVLHCKAAATAGPLQLDVTTDHCHLPHHGGLHPQRRRAAPARGCDAYGRPPSTARCSCAPSHQDGVYASAADSRAWRYSSCLASSWPSTASCMRAENDCRRLLATTSSARSATWWRASGWARRWHQRRLRHAFAHILYKGLCSWAAGGAAHDRQSKFTELGGYGRRCRGRCLHSHRRLVHLRFRSSAVCQQVMIVSAGSRKARLGLASCSCSPPPETFLHTGLKVPYFIWFGRT